MSTTDSTRIRSPGHSPGTRCISGTANALQQWCTRQAIPRTAGGGRHRTRLASGGARSLGTLRLGLQAEADGRLIVVSDVTAINNRPIPRVEHYDVAARGQASRV